MKKLFSFPIKKQILTRIIKSTSTLGIITTKKVIDKNLGLLMHVASLLLSLGKPVT